MTQYIFKRLLLIIPTLFGIMLLNFAIIQAAPGGPVDKLIFQLTNNDSMNTTSRFSGSGNSETGAVNLVKTQANLSRSSRGLDEDLIKEIKKIYGFDKPAYIRFFTMVKNYLTFDFGESFFRSDSVISLIADKLPVSISLGFWTTILVYLISIPLGIRKATKDGEIFDIITSWIIIITYAIPSFLFAILLIILFAGGSYWDIFPMQGIISKNWSELSIIEQIKDYFWHITLPVFAMVISGFASLTMLSKNSFIDEISKQYVTTARAKGLSEGAILYKHIFRNAMLIIIAGFPSALIKILFTSSLLIEVIFSLDGLGLLGFEAAINRDYPVMFATLYIFTIIGLFTNLIGDLLYMIIDPRIDFSAR